MRSRERAETQAAEWIARRERGDWSGPDEAELSSWIAASMDNRVAWLRLRAAWQQGHRLKSLVVTVPAGRVPTPAEIRDPFLEGDLSLGTAGLDGEGIGKREHADTHVVGSYSRVSHRVVRVALAAGILLAMVAGAVWRFMPSGASYHTEVGALQSVPLPDGSRVTLNTNTDIRVDVTPTERRVNLEQGEAYFEVAKDPRRPFVVRVGDRRVVAIGTRFSVRRENDDVRVFVTEGTVRLESASPDPTLLHAGSIARAESDSVLVHEKPIAEVEQLLSWRSGHLVFDRTPLADAVAEFNRYNRRRIVIQDPQIAAIPIGGNFRVTNVEGFVRLIVSDFPITAIQQGDEVVLAAKPAPP